MTADEQYRANCAILAQRPGMEQMPMQLDACPLTNIQLMPGATGQLYGQAWDMHTQQWAALCSYADPLAEAEKDVDALYTRDQKVFTLLGMGLGYFATAFAKRLEPWQRLVVWDLDPMMFKAMMYACDISPLFSHRRTDVYIGTELLHQVEPWWLKLDAVEKLYILPPFRASYTSIVHKDAYDALMQKTIDMLRFHAVGLSTWKIFGGCIGDNDLRNLPDYFLNPGYEHLKDAWKDRPAVCVAAGPSLQKNLRHLFPPAVREQVALISAGTVYGLLHGLGLQPDVVTTIDFQRLNWTDQFQHIPLDPECPLVYLHSTYPQTVRRWPGPKFVAENASDTVGWIRQYGEGKKSAAQVQTVAHLNVMVALELGANPIILLGQDLSMPPESHHASGARAQDLAPQEAGPDAFVEVQDYQGHTVHTRHSFLSMKTVFERLVLENPDRTFINCSEGGIALAGVQNIPLQEAMKGFAEQPRQRGELRRHLKSVWKDYKPQVKDTFAADFAQLCTSVEELGVLAHRVPGQVQTILADAETCLTPDMQAARLASDCLTEQETVEDITHSKLERVLDQERILQERPAALGLFAIRRFDFLELMSRIPPKESDLPTPLSRSMFNVQRLLEVAAMIREELPHVQQLLREAKRRMHGSERRWSNRLIAEMPVDWLAAQQRYDLVVSGIKYGGTLTSYAHYLYHTQQYEAASTVMQFWGFAPEKVARIQRYLAAWQADVREAIPAYFQPMGDNQQHLDSAEAWCYD